MKIQTETLPKTAILQAQPVNCGDTRFCRETAAGLLRFREPVLFHDDAYPARPRPALGRDRRQKRDMHALSGDGMVVCNPRDKEAAHRAEMEGIATADRAAVTCRKCLALLYQLDRERKEDA